MRTTCRRCKRSSDPAGLGPLGAYLLLEAAMVLLLCSAVLADSWPGTLFGLSLAGIVAWALWRNHRDREASICPACASQRGDDP